VPHPGLAKIKCQSAPRVYAISTASTARIVIGRLINPPLARQGLVMRRISPGLPPLTPVWEGRSVTIAGDAHRASAPALTSAPLRARGFFFWKSYGRACRRFAKATASGPGRLIIREEAIAGG